MKVTFRLAMDRSKGKLRCTNVQGGTEWEIDVVDLELIAEYTTNEGPYLDDYYLVFVTREQGRLWISSCTFYADGRDEALKELAGCLGASIETGLANSTDWKSRVIWPAALRKVDYFVFSQVQPNNAFSGAKKLLLGPTLEYVISPVVRKHLGLPAQE